MKAILEFNLPEEAQEFNRSNKAIELCLVIWDIQQILRKYRKYEELTEEQNTLFDKIDTEIFDVFKDHSIDIDELLS